MGNVIDQSGNVHTQNLYIGTTVAIDSSCNFYGENVNLKKININNKKFVDSLRNITAGNITCGSINSGEIKINGKTVLDKNLNLTVNSFICDAFDLGDQTLQCKELIVDTSGATIVGDIMCYGSTICNNLYLPVIDGNNTVGRVRCATVNTQNIIIPTDNNCFFANMNFSLVLNGTDGSISTTKITSLNGLDTSGNVNCIGLDTNQGQITCGNIEASGYSITCEKINHNKFIFPTIESNSTQGADVFLPKTDLTEGETYYDKFTGTIYVFKTTDSGLNVWNVFTASTILNASPT